MRRFFLAALGSLIATPLLAADMAVKAPPPVASSAPSWTGFYIGLDAGYGWPNNAANISPNDPATAAIFAGTIPGAQPAVGSFRLRQGSAVGGLEAGYNWQAGPNWLWGVEADLSFARINGQAAGSSILSSVVPPPVVQTTSMQQTADRYETVRGRLGWLATPELMIFGSGGFAFGKVTDSASYAVNAPNSIGINTGGFSALCQPSLPCITGTSTATRTGWTAGGGVEWMLSPHVSLKTEYQLIDLGTQTVRATALAVSMAGTAPTSFSAVFRDEIQILRVGLNWHL